MKRLPIHAALRRRTALLAAGLASALAAVTLAAPASAAGGPRLFVVALQAPPSLTFTGKSLGEVVASEARKLGGLEVLGPDDVEARVGRRAYVRLVDCAGEPRCLAEAGAALGADRIVGGHLALLPSRYQVRVTQVEVMTGHVLATFSREVPIAARRLQADVAAASGALLRGEAEGLGSIFVIASVPDAEVRIDGEKAGLTPLGRSSRPGKHHVQVSKAGYFTPEPQWVDVVAGAVADVQVLLVPLSTGEIPSAR